MRLFHCLQRCGSKTSSPGLLCCHRLKPMTTLLAALLMLTASAFAIDANGDGMDDAWQTLYNIAPFTGSLDPDGDGRPNLVESMCWTNPNVADVPYGGWGFIIMRDTNHDRIDDGWAVKYFPGGMVTVDANGQPLQPTTPLATSPANGIYSDPDGDGRSNLEESIAGTNPLVADVPWQQLDAPVATVGPSEFSMQFRSLPMILYQVQDSADLINWQNATLITPASSNGQLWGDGSVKLITMATGGAPRKFFRIQLLQTNGGPLDSDGDGLSDWYEINVFHTNPFNADSDGDGIPDGWEAAYGLSPSYAADALLDGDSDGIKNIDEYTFHLDPRHDDFTEKAMLVTFDGADHVQSVTKPGGGATSFIYDAEGNLISSH
jgi:YD repeat-containing protein